MFHILGKMDLLEEKEKEKENQQQQPFKTHES